MPQAIVWNLFVDRVDELVMTDVVKEFPKVNEQHVTVVPMVAIVFVELLF